MTHTNLTRTSHFRDTRRRSASKDRYSHVI
jgi:hypothetical protein